MLHHGGIQAAAVLGHVGKVHEGLVAEAQGQVQVPQSDVAVQAQHLLAAKGQRGAGARHEGGLSRAALAGHHGDTLSMGCHARPPYHIFVLNVSNTYYNGFFLIFANGLGYFFGVSLIFLIKITRWDTPIPGIW